LSATTIADAPRPAPSASIAAVELRSVTHRYAGRTAVDALSLAIPTGAIFGLLGPNGCGKSTLLSLLVGLREPAEGDVRVLGAVPGPDVRRHVGMVFQERSLDALMTVRETMRLQARLFGMPRAAAEHEAQELIARLGLEGREDAATGTLSGGLKRRLELARALLPGPRLLLLDEPTLALDPEGRQALWNDLLTANRDGCTLVLATNDVYEAERYCETVVLLDEGRIVAEGAPADLKRSLRRDAVRIDWADGAGAPKDLDEWPHVGSVRHAGRTTHVSVDGASAFLARLFEQLGGTVEGVHIEPTTLEDVYFQLAGHGIGAPAEDRR
jgi:ABC-2 type transport system ATP-binding protein